MQTQNATMRRWPGLLDPKTATRIPTKVAMATASRAAMMIFFLFFDRQPMSKDFEFLASTDVQKCCGLTLVESFLVKLKSFNLRTLIFSISKGKVLSHLFFSSSLQNGEILACIEIPLGHLLEDDLKKQISRLNSWTNSWEEQSARPVTASRWSWSPGTWGPACLFSPSRCNSAPEERLKSISQYTLATKHTTLSSEAVHQNLYQPLSGEIVRAPAEWSPLEGVKNKSILWEAEKRKL